MIEKEPAIQQEIDNSLAYAVANMKLTKVPIVGAGGGEGVIFIKETQQRIYFTVGRFDIGGGWGARSYKALLVVETQKVLDRWKMGYGNSRQELRLLQVRPTQKAQVEI
ncbi:hypothetical protein MNBD_GAMMA25-1473 [hydrothermal vent metagenome]|uniref:Uncharacterized protein n=1 Tax=hydrothermal vent metagenome TaxID=652676 RepID=A0A3B1C2D9_9ZZZZ